MTAEQPKLEVAGLCDCARNDGVEDPTPCNALPTIPPPVKNPIPTEAGHCIHCRFSSNHCRLCAKICLPDSVIRYRCLLLLGFSGIVIATQPAASIGFNTRLRNLVRLVRPVSAISSEIAISFKQLCRVSSCSWLGPDLVPAWSRPGPRDGINLPRVKPGIVFLQ